MSIYTFHNELKPVVDGDVTLDDCIIIYDASTNSTRSCTIEQLMNVLQGTPVATKEVANRKAAEEKAAKDAEEEAKLAEDPNAPVAKTLKTDEDDEDKHSPRSGRKSWKGE